jgi:hypothetical protein
MQILTSNCHLLYLRLKPNLKLLGEDGHQKLTIDSGAMLAVLATACQTIINLNTRITTLPAMPDPSSDDRGVFLGGSCNPTTWRLAIAIPAFSKHGIKYYNPQVLLIALIEHLSRYTGTLLIEHLSRYTGTLLIEY